MYNKAYRLGDIVMPEAISYMDLEGMELQAAVNHFTDFEFYFLSDVDHGSRYALKLKEGDKTAMMSEDAVQSFNENLPDAYVCAECDVISNDLADYGCSNCGNGEDMD